MRAVARKRALKKGKNRGILEIWGVKTRICPAGRPKFFKNRDFSRKGQKLILSLMGKPNREDCPRE